MSQILDETPKNLDESVLSIDESVLSLDKSIFPLDDSKLVTGNRLLASFPPIGDRNHNNYKFYQVEKGQFSTIQTDFIWEITDSVGSGIFKTEPTVDIRAFAGLGRVDISKAVSNNNVFDPDMTINVIQLSDDQLHLFVWELNQVIHEYILSAPRVFPLFGTPSDFTFAPAEINGRDMKFVDNGKKIVICGFNLKSIQLYGLPSPNSFRLTPVLEQTFVPFTTDTPLSCEFSEDGLILDVINSELDQIHQFNLTAPFVLPDNFTPANRIFSHNPPIITSGGNIRMFRDGSGFDLMSNDPMQISQYTTDGKNQLPIINKPPEFFKSITVDNNLRAMSLSVGRDYIWFSGRTTNRIHELFIPGIPLEYDIVTVNTTTGDFTIKVKVPALLDLSFIQLAFGNPAAIDNSALLGAGTVLSTHTTPLLTKDEKNFLVDDKGRKIKVVGQ